MIYILLYIFIDTVLGVGDTRMDKTIKNGVAYLGSDKDHE